MNFKFASVGLIFTPTVLGFLSLAEELVIVKSYFGRSACVR
jgi:hypothetical protein